MLHPPPGPCLADWIGMRWTPDPLVIGGLAIAATIYTVGAVRLWRHAGAGRGVRPWQALAHGAGLVAIALALLSPLDRASDVLFSAHMAQHELLMLIAAPLVVVGRPLAAAAWALPRVARVRLSRLAPIGRALTHPVVALVLHVAARLVWHLPIAFDAALGDERVHAFQHVTFFGTAVLFWWALLRGRYGRGGYGVGVVFVFLTMLQSGLLAAALGFASHPLYEHGARTAAWGIDALVDQQRAGLVMWVPGGILMMALGLAIFAAWLGQAERAARHL